MYFHFFQCNRNDVRYLKSLGESIVELCNSIPGGLLIFFASYPVMELCHNYWKNNFNIWTKMQTKRPIYCEAKGESSDKLVETMKKYYNSIDNGDGAIFMAVLRGKVSEGVDFTDMYGRATIIVGIPFAPCREIKVQSKMNYMDIRRSNDRKVMSGSDWYSLDAIKAVNQAIGRVIRHKDDYGAILLFDIRYKEWNKYRHLSTWVQKNPSFGTFDHFQTMNKKLKAFFTHCEQTVWCLVKFIYGLHFSISFFCFFYSFRNQRQSINRYQCNWISVMMIMSVTICIMKMENPLFIMLQIHKTSTAVTEIS